MKKTQLIATALFALTVSTTLSNAALASGVSGSSPVYTYADTSTTSSRLYADHFDCFAYYTPGATGGKYVQHAHGTLNASNQYYLDTWELRRFVLVSENQTKFDDTSHSGHAHRDQNSSHFEEFWPYTVVSSTYNSLSFSGYYKMVDRAGVKPDENHYIRRYANNF